LGWSCGGGLFGLLAQGVDDDAQHLFLGGGLAGPDLELAGALLDEHLDAGDDIEALLTGGADERGVGGVVDQVEDDLGAEFFGGEEQAAVGGTLVAGHADGRGVDDDVEAGRILLAVERFALEDLCAGLAGELGGGFGGAVEDVDLGALLAQTEDGGAAVRAVNGPFSIRTLMN